MPPSVRAGDVFRLAIPGDNGETKSRFSIVLDAAPSPSNPELVVIIFGCSRTRKGSDAERHVRVEPENRAWFNKLGLRNGTTFHLEDIRFHDAASPKLLRRLCACPPMLFLQLRKLLEKRLDEDIPIEILPRSAPSRLGPVADAYRRESSVIE